MRSTRERLNAVTLWITKNTTLSVLLSQADLEHITASLLHINYETKVKIALHLLQYHSIKSA